MISAKGWSARFKHQAGNKPIYTYEPLIAWTIDGDGDVIGIVLDSEGLPRTAWNMDAFDGYEQTNSCVVGVVPARGWQAVDHGGQRHPVVAWAVRANGNIEAVVDTKEGPLLGSDAVLSLEPVDGWPHQPGES